MGTALHGGDSARYNVVRAPQTQGKTAAIGTCFSKIRPDALLPHVQYAFVALIRSGLRPSSISGQRLRSFWQPGFHDHVLRNDESHGEKWSYVRENPVRAGLVLNADDWPYAGEIVIIDRV